ncbi:hypothetical protein LINPERHAP2_LOCUS138 [Linum perenne]
MVVSSFLHYIFQVPADEDKYSFQLPDDVNYVFVWSFLCGSTIKTRGTNKTLHA